MTNVISRHFDSPETARAVERRLIERRLARKIVTVHTDADGLVEKLKKAHVAPETAEAYEWRVKEGGAVVVVQAGHKPLGVAQTSREVMAEMGATDLGNLTEEVIVMDAVATNSSIMDDHPRFMTREKDPNKTNFYMADWPIPLISKRKPYDEIAFDRHARMAEWPIPLTVRMQPRDEYAFPRHARMANLIFPLTVRRKPNYNSIFPRHARMANVILPLTNRRKPYTGSLIGKHPRMANWPFPHLINGETGTNSLMPGGPRMADWPIDLLSDQKPADKFAFPRHARMANLLLPLTNRRKPFTGSMFPRHARMANLILPLLTKRTASSGDAKGTWFSRIFGWKTIIRR